MRVLNALIPFFRQNNDIKNRGKGRKNLNISHSSRSVNNEEILSIFLFFLLFILSITLFLVYNKRTNKRIAVFLGFDKPKLYWFIPRRDKGRSKNFSMFFNGLKRENFLTLKKLMEEGDLWLLPP